jgi:hypothetical protein
MSSQLVFKRGLDIDLGQGAETLGLQSLLHLRKHEYLHRL